MNNRTVSISDDVKGDNKAVDGNLDCTPTRHIFIKEEF